MNFLTTKRLFDCPACGCEETDVTDWSIEKDGGGHFTSICPTCSTIWTDDVTVKLTGYWYSETIKRYQKVEEEGGSDA